MLPEIPLPLEPLVAGGIEAGKGVAADTAGVGVEGKVGGTGVSRAKGSVTRRLTRSGLCERERSGDRAPLVRLGRVGTWARAGIPGREGEEREESPAASLRMDGEDPSEERC
uniref:Uncharacterized protein n=1 Tax=Thermogemmatispora argillosa TaxID=2045280 RepID=A0A455T767_9CHLR|nr:hypothetical protein KTA_34340 [Thermogemmatispora argillosa]